MPAVRKSLDAIYAATKLVTGFSYEDSRSFAEFSAWARDLNIDLSQAVPGAPGKPSSPPSKRKLAQAGAFVDDLVRLSHLDEMVGDVRRFMREVETTISLISACGTLPPVNPVLPPCGTMPMPVSAQMRTMAATSADDWGLNTRGTRPSQPSRKLLQ